MSLRSCDGSWLHVGSVGSGVLDLGRFWFLGFGLFSFGGGLLCFWWSLSCWESLGCKRALFRFGVFGGSCFVAGGMSLVVLSVVVSSLCGPCVVGEGDRPRFAFLRFWFFDAYVICCPLPWGVSEFNRMLRRCSGVSP